MRFKLCVFTFAVWTLLLCNVGQAQTSGVAEGKSIPGDVTFEVPLNLTRLSPYISMVAVTCKFGRDITYDRETQTNRVELPVAAGQVVTTVSVVVAAPTTTIFKPGEKLEYECALTALSSEPRAGSGWQPFDPKAMGESLHVSPTPLPIKDSFTW